MNHKRTYRIYRDEGLSIRPKLPKRKRAWRYRQGRPAIGEPKEVWAMDFTQRASLRQLSVAEPPSTFIEAPKSPMTI